MKIAIVGSGISGLGAAYALSDRYEVKLFEKNTKFGGHSNTVDIQIGGKRTSVDTGFIVYNTQNYPNLTSLFKHLEVPTKWSDMSFGFSSENGNLEYSGSNLDTLFAQRKNLLNFKFVNGLREILRFNREAPIAMDSGELTGLSLGEFLSRHKYRKWFVENFILPMGGAIWSTPQAEILNFPASNFISFFRNHGLLSGLSRTQVWRTVDGGSKVYVNKIIQKLGSSAVVNRSVVSISRSNGTVDLTLNDGSIEKFDHAVICSHAPEAMKIVTNKTPEESNLLEKFKTSQNRTILHSDKSLMPKRSKAWSSWNFLSTGAVEDFNGASSVTYWMNRLQGIDIKTPVFVSLNPLSEPDPSSIYAEFNYAHPIFNAESFDAQEKMDNIQGDGGVWYAGAWLGYGFHEDGLTAGLRIASALGSTPDWARNISYGLKNRFSLRAAE